MRLLAAVVLYSGDTACPSLRQVRELSSTLETQSRALGASQARKGLNKPSQASKGGLCCPQELKYMRCRLDAAGALCLSLVVVLRSNVLQGIYGKRLQASVTATSFLLHECETDPAEVEERPAPGRLQTEG